MQLERKTVKQGHFHGSSEYSNFAAKTSRLKYFSDDTKFNVQCFSEEQFGTVLHAAASRLRLFTFWQHLPVSCAVMLVFFIFVLCPSFQLKFIVGLFSASSSFLVLFIPVFFWTGSLVSMCDLHSLWFSESKTYVPATRPKPQLQALKRAVEFKATFSFNENCTTKQKPQLNNYEAKEKAAHFGQKTQGKEGPLWADCLWPPGRTFCSWP